MNRVKMRALLNMAYKAGWFNSGEEWNQEYPFAKKGIAYTDKENPRAKMWRQQRQRAINLIMLGECNSCKSL